MGSPPSFIFTNAKITTLLRTTPHCMLSMTATCALVVACRGCLCGEYLQAFFPLATPYELPNFGNQQVHGSHSLVIWIQSHIECLQSIQATLTTAACTATAWLQYSKCIVNRQQSSWLLCHALGSAPLAQCTGMPHCCIGCEYPIYSMVMSPGTMCSCRKLRLINYLLQLRWDNR